MDSGATAQPIDGRFQLMEQLGGGGMGLVWRAYDLALEREVALKEVRSSAADLGGDPAAAELSRQRVLREARALARLQHPNVVTIHHIVDSPELRYPWLVMELVTGGSLDGLLKREGALTSQRAARIGRGIAAALNAAHGAGIQHRDVKPANVLLRPDGTPVLTDFGIAALQGTTSLTATGTMIGSPEYMAPERIRGQEGYPASDLWSLGMLLYVTVEGHHPLRRDTNLATLAAVLDQPIPPPLRAGALAPVIGALLQRDPWTRPTGDVAELMLADAERQSGADSVEQARSPAPYAVPHAPAPADARTPGSSERSRSGLRFAAVVAAVAAAGLVGALVWTANSGASTSPQARGGATATASTPTTGSPATATGILPAPLAPPGTTVGGSGTNLFAATGLTTLISALRPVMGGSKVLMLDVFQTYAVAEAPSVSNPQFYDDFLYMNQTAKKNMDGGAISDLVSPATVDLTTIDWSVVPGLLQKAAAQLNVSNPTERYVVVDPDYALTNSVALLVYVGNGYGTGYLAADPHGHILSTHPLGS